MPEHATPQDEASDRADVHPAAPRPQEETDMLIVRRVFAGPLPSLETFLRELDEQSARELENLKF